MSRSGTLQDALRSVDAFQRAENSVASLKSAGHGSPRVIRIGASDDVIKSEKKHKEKKDERRREERRVSKGRKSSKSSRQVRDDNSEFDYVDTERQVSKGRKSSKSSRRVRDHNSGFDYVGSEDKEKERRHSDSRRHSEPEFRKKDTKPRRSDRRGEREKSGSRRTGHKHEGRKSGRSKNDSFSSEDGSFDDSASLSSHSENENGAFRPENVAKEIIEEFPELTSDLKELLQMVDSGQGVDISGLPSKRVITLLQKLFRSLRLDLSKAGIYLLPSGAQPTLQRVGLFMEYTAEVTPGSDHVYEGPELPSSTTKNSEASQADDENVKMSQKGTDEDEPTGPLKRRVMGPAMPSKDMLEAAAKLTEAEAALRAAEEELEGDPMIGPPEPAAVAEAAFANEAERFEEVTRILGRDVGNAYEILGLKREVSAADLKKRYWKLSLLVHPDKCEHPQAHEAFMALSKAFKDLQDPSKRSIIDQKAEEKEAREEYEADLRAKRDAAQWRKLRGDEALPGDAELLMGEAKQVARDEWMTVLPPERQAGKPTQKSTYFSRSEKSGRGDTSAWTDTPLEKAQKAKMQYLEAYRQAALTGPEPEKSVFEREKAAKTGAIIDQYNEKKRALSLVEKHQRENMESKKKKKKGGGEASLPSKEKARKEKEWQENHPWKPWDREKNFQAGRQAMQQDIKSIQEGLGSRFGTSTGERRFL